MKIKGVIKNLKIKKFLMTIAKYIQEFLWSCCRQCEVSSASDSSLFQLILLLLKLYRLLPMQSVLTTGFSSVAPVTSKAVPSSLFILASSVCKSLQCLISTLTQGVKSGHLVRVTCSVVLWGWGGERNTANKYHWRVWGVLAVSGSHWVCPHTWRVCFSRLHCSGFQVALQGNCPKQTLCFMHFPGLNCSGSGSWVLHKGTDSVGSVFCALPRSEQLSRPGGW